MTASSDALGTTPDAGARRWIRPAVGLVATGVFVWLAFGTISWRGVRGVIAGARVAPLVLALVLLAADFTVRITRWWWMLRVLAPRLPLRACARPFLVSMALNNTLPLRAGDVARAVAFRETLGAPTMRVVGTLLIERVLDLFALVALFFVGLLATPAGGIPRGLIVGGAMLGGVTLLAAALLVVAPGALLPIAERVMARPSLASRRWTPRLLAGVRQLFDTLALVQSPARAAQLLGLSALAWLLEGAVFACVAWSLGTGGGPLAPWFACATGTLATLIPSSPGYVGTFDFFVIRGLAAHGADATAAAAFAMIVHLVLWVPVTVVGLALLAGAGSRRAARSTPPAAELA
jgi:uncharacterized protein (TIRG00374 family)